VEEDSDSVELVLDVEGEGEGDRAGEVRDENLNQLLKEEEDFLAGVANGEEGMT
jgi:hypothetical protein